MWLIISLVFICGAIGMLLAGLFWPLLWQAQHSSEKSRWFESWWHYWLYITAPLLNWRHRQRVEHLLARAGHDGSEVNTLFAKQCLITVIVFFIGLAALYGVVGIKLVVALLLSGLFSAAMYWYPVSVLHRKIKQQQVQLQRDFPFMLDLLTLSMEAGMGMLSALQLCVAQLPPQALKRHLQTVLEDLRTGLSREQAFKRFAERTNTDETQAFVAALQQSFELGGSLGPLLRQQAQQRRQERFLRAEKKALEAPVKMLLPLVVCIFPCTFLVIGYPLFFQLSQNL